MRAVTKDGCKGLRYFRVMVLGFLQTSSRVWVFCGYYCAWLGCSYSEKFWVKQDTFFIVMLHPLLMVWTP